MPGSLGVGLRIDERLNYESPHPNPSAPCGGAGGPGQVAFGPAAFANCFT